jgi:hypothetical protein
MICLMQVNLHFYIKIRGNIIQNSTCYVGLQQYNSTVYNRNFLDLVFANFYDSTIAISDFELVVPGTILLLF